MLRRSLLLAVLILAGMVHSADGDEFATWSSKSGDFKVEAKLVRIQDERAILQKRGGVTVGVPLGALHRDDLIRIILHLAAKTRTGPPAPSDAEKIRMAKRQLALFHNTTQMYRLDLGRVPSKAEGLDALLKAPKNLPNPRKWRGPYVRSLPQDPWGRPYRYTATSENATITSDGPDGKPNTPDDVRR